MSTYFAILTEVGEAKLANAIALGNTLKLKSMAVGDGNGTLPMPDRKQKTLVHEVRRAGLNQLTIDPSNASQIIVEQVLPEDVGGWWIREIGIYDEAGDLCAVANCPPSYKPVMSEGSGRTQVVRIVLIVTSAASVELKIDPSVILATRKYVDEQRAGSDTLLAKQRSYIDEQDSKVMVYGEQKLAEQRAYVDSQDSKVMIYSEQQLADHLDAANPHPKLARISYVDTQDQTGKLYSDQQLAGHMNDDDPHPTLAQQRYVDEQDSKVMIYGEQKLAEQRAYVDSQDSKVMIYSEQQLAGHLDAANPHPKLARISYVDTQDQTGKLYSDQQLAGHMNDVDPHPQYSKRQVETLAKFDHSKKLANTEFVQENGVRHSAAFGFSAAARLDAQHVGAFIYSFGNGGFTLTLPASAGLPAGACLSYSNQGGISSAPVTISTQGTDTIQSNGGFNNACKISSGSSITLVHTGGGAWMATGTAVLSETADFASSLTTNGYQRLPSGEIRQWAQAVIDGSGIVSFPIAFPNALLTVSAVSGNGVSPMYYATGPSTLSSVTVTANAPGAAVVTIYATGK